MKPSRKPTARYHHGDLRNAALAAAERILQKEGVEALTLRRVAAQVRVSPMALYNHFEGKGALLVALAEAGFVALREAILQAAPNELAPLERLQRGAVAYVLFGVEDRERFALMFGGVGEAILHEPKLRDAVLGAFATLVDCLAECVRAGLLRGDPIEAERTVWAAAHGYAALWNSVPMLMRGERSQIRQNAQRMVMSVLDGLRVPPKA
jgi:AcrR family transcriptional regulator